jgi:hypothetical protein
MTNLISKLRQACHDERSKNREATEVQLYALQLCADVEKYILHKNKFLGLQDSPDDYRIFNKKVNGKYRPLSEYFEKCIGEKK